MVRLADHVRAQVQAQPPKAKQRAGQPGKHPLRHRCERGRLAGNRMLLRRDIIGRRRRGGRPAVRGSAATALVGPGYRLLHAAAAPALWVGED